MKKLNTILREKMDSKNINRERLAKKLDISPSYMSHLMYGSKVHISDRVWMKLKTILGLSASLKTAVERNNRAAAKYYREYRAKNAS